MLPVLFALVACAQVPKPILGLEATCKEPYPARTYLEALHSNVLRRWDPQVRSSPQRVEIRFQIDAHGQLLSSELLDATSAEAGESALAALEAAAPYPRVAASATCIVDRWLTATFDFVPHVSGR
jgi:hypothetical protein